ncbi:MAG: DUF1343 domain-containing protein [Anaerolineae bacterium]|nr:DUF1343 domain-containing protein [Anaerolineae bacterium]
MNANHPTLPGIDVLVQQNFAPLRGKRVGLFTNPSGVTRDLVQTLDLFRAADVPFRLAALFTPEHGLTASAADGDPVKSSVDPISGVPVYSLYGETFAPTSAMLNGIEMIVCDIQDIGIRYYTFAWTISHILEAAGLADVPVLILDRPNPIGGGVDGALLDRCFASLIGRAAIPVQHGLTLGELMRTYNTLWNESPAALSVIPCAHYQRAQTWEDAGLPFVPPSPAMPHLSTARQYPGACLLEGTNLSEGRGTALPFEIAGAPFIDSEALAAHLNALDLPGVRFRPHVFAPFSSKFAGEVCHGVQVHITGAEFRPLRVWMQVIQAIRLLYPEDFLWKPGTFDRLYGNEDGRAWVESGAGIEDLLEKWEADAESWRAARQPFLLYD